MHSRFRTNGPDHNMTWYGSSSGRRVMGRLPDLRSFISSCWPEIKRQLWRLQPNQENQKTTVRVPMAGFRKCSSNPIEASKPCVKDKKLDHSVFSWQDGSR